MRNRFQYAVLPVLLLVAEGCHKKQTVAYTPPPPPSVSAPVTRAPRPVPGPGEAQGPTAVQPEAQGKPISSEVGLASWYGPPYFGRKGADGTVYDQNAMTAAHLTLPMGSIVRVTNLTNGQSVMVKITDRGPFVRGRIIDLSLAAAKATGVYRAGVAKVRVEAYAAPIRANAMPGGRWCVQIGAFYNAEDAMQLKNDLLRRYATAKVIEFPGPTGHWVRINPKTPDRQHAEQVAESIHIPDAEAYLIRTD